MKPTPIATPVKAFEAIAPATNLKPITNNKNVANEYCKAYNANVMSSSPKEK